MEENSMIRMEEVKERKVEIVKDSNTATDSEKEIADKKEQERKERKFLIQLIAILCTWIFLIILFMRYERRGMAKPKVPTTKPKVVKGKPIVQTQITKTPKPTVKQDVKTASTPLKKAEIEKPTKTTNEKPTENKIKTKN